MRFREFRLPFAGALLLAASGLTFAFATNGASDSAGTIERPTIAAAPSVAVVRRVEHDRHVVAPVSKRPAAAHIVAARTLRAPVPSRTQVPSRPRPRTAVIVAKVPAKHSIALVVRKRAAPPSRKAKADAQNVALRGAAIASQPFSIVRFVGSKRTIARGDSVTLCARATGAERLRIVPLGPIDPLRRTCRIVRPRKTTTYTLLAQGPGGDKMTQNVTIAVNKRTPPPGHAMPPLDHDPGP